MRAYFTAHRFIVDREDARLAIAACGGASTCERGTTDNRADALALMPIARRLCKTGVALHVSGCAKGCARQAATPFTLIARAGLYDLVVDGTAVPGKRCEAPRSGGARETGHDERKSGDASWRGNERSWLNVTTMSATALRSIGSLLPSSAPRPIYRVSQRTRPRSWCA